MFIAAKSDCFIRVYIGMAGIISGTSGKSEVLDSSDIKQFTL